MQSELAICRSVACVLVRRQLRLAHFISLIHCSHASAFIHELEVLGRLIHDTTRVGPADRGLSPHPHGLLPAHGAGTGVEIGLQAADPQVATGSGPDYGCSSSLHSATCYWQWGFRLSRLNLNVLVEGPSG